MANNNGNGSKQNNSREDLAKAAQASAKKSQNSKNQGEKRGLFSRLVGYLKGVRQEFKKVVWPTREELTTNTIVVFACVVFFAVTFWLIDTGFLAALKGILGITLS